LSSTNYAANSQAFRELGAQLAKIFGMNLLVFSARDTRPDGTLLIEGRRAEHISKVLKLGPGDILKVGEENGLRGKAHLLEVSPERVVLDIPSLDVRPPEPWFDMILAMPRPRVFGRVLQHLTSLGVCRLALVNCHKVEKSFFGSPLLSDESIDENILLGLEQAGLTQKPQVEICGPGLGLGHSLKNIATEQTFRLCADLQGVDLSEQIQVCSAESALERPVLAVGPEGGWVPSEIESFIENRFKTISLGQRVLRVETAVIYLVALLESFNKRK